jgi:chemotaxis protein MotA
MKATTGVSKAIMRAILPKAMPSPAVSLERLVDYANRARHDGILSLEADVAELDDPFMKKALQLAIDGNDPEAVADVMRTDIRTMKARHKVGADWCMTYGIFAPTFGIIGAVFGLIATLGHLDQPELLGHGISAAFIATFWGVFAANGIMLPLANKMKRMSAEEVAGREMVMEGVLSIQGGQNPRVIEEILMTYLPPSEARALKAATASE